MLQVERGESLKRLQKGVLRDVFGGGWVPEQSRREVKHRPPVPVDDLPIGRLVPFQRLPHELRISASHVSFPGANPKDRLSRRQTTVVESWD